MNNFLNEYETNISNEFIKNGYISNDDWLNGIHKMVKIEESNDFRLEMINSSNNQEMFRENYFNVAKKYLDIIVGNELAMQIKVNLSIQLPNDNSSLLPVHADTWSGDSPFEIVVWIPLVNCYNTKSMFI